MKMGGKGFHIYTTTRKGSFVIIGEMCICLASGNVPKIQVYQVGVT
jgi:hypothetical protein